MVRMKALALGALSALAVGAMAWRSAMPGPIVATVPLGTFPGAVTIDAQDGRAYVPNYMDTTVDVLNSTTGRVLRTFTVGSNGGAHPEDVATDATAHRLFVLTDDGLLSMFNADSGALLRTAPVGGTGLSMAVDARRARLFVADADAATVSVLDARTGSLVRATRTGAFPQAIAADEATDRVFVADAGDDTVSVLDARTGTTLRRTSLIVRPDTLLVVPALREVFIASEQDQHQIAVLDARSGALLRTLTLHGPAKPNAVPSLAVDPGTDHLFFAIRSDVRMLDARSGRLLHSAHLDSPVAMLAMDSHDSTCFALTFGTLDAAQHLTSRGALVALDARTGAVRGRVTAGVGPRYLGIDPLHRRVLVVNSNVNPDGSLATPLPAPNWWAQQVPWLRGLLPSPVQARDGHGSATVIDVSRL